MKKILSVVAILIMIPFSASCKEVVKDIEISPCEGEDECMRIETRGGPVYRVYACGKLDKLTWKQLNRNEEDHLIFTALSGTFAGGVTLTNESND